MICENCIHNAVCKYGEARSNGLYCAGEKCKQYQSTDVVPKSEVYGFSAEELAQKVEGLTIELEAMRCAANSYKMHYENLAREIFEEIEKEIEEALKSNYKVLPQFEASEELYHNVHGKISALCGIDGFIEELKKKYTEE